MQRISVLLSALLLAVVAIAGPAGAHGAPPTEEYEIHLLDDGGFDATLFVPTGYEIDSVIYREAYLPEHGGHGIAIYTDIYGGASFFDSEAFMIYEFDGPDGTTTMTMSTTDDETWEGDGAVLALDAAEYGLAAQARVTDLTVFFTLEQLGLEIGEELTTMRLATAWDAGFGMWAFDRVPGGTAVAPAPAPVSDVLIPESFETHTIEPRTIHGGTEHLGVVLDGQVISVSNPFIETPQQVKVERDGAVIDTFELAPGETVSVDAGTGTTTVFSNIGGFGQVTR